MRINLVTPFEEKDTVKALGARWDAARKVWYITDVADLTPFLRWISDLEKATEKSPSGSVQKATSSPVAPIGRSEGVMTTSTVEIPCCDCKVLPWEDCEHTVAA
jgi:hypothetical protein